jgi:YD repeat-containing protein
MRIRIAVALMLLGTPAVAEPTQLFYNERGQITGSASTSANVTTFRDRSGRMTGTAERQRDGTTLFRDGQGRMTGSATAPRR